MAALATHAATHSVCLRLSKQAADDAPSVADVVRLADVNRSSFYAHFDDLGDLGLLCPESALDDIYAGQSATVHQQNPQQPLTATRIVRIVAGNSATLAALDNVADLTTEGRSELLAPPDGARFLSAATAQCTIIQKNRG